MSIDCSSPIDSYNKNGFAILQAFTEKEFALLENFSRGWLNALLEKWTSGNTASFSLEKYHTWFQKLGVDHSPLFCATNRHTIPGEEIARIITANAAINKFLSDIGLEKKRLWDEGLGWLAYRFIRPGVSDGYPFTRKAWGIAKNVVSGWLPIIGFSPSETITFLPGSHLRDYEQYLPTETKFRKDEFRLVHEPKPEERYNPSLKPGEIILFHPLTLHCEEVCQSTVTRLNLEFRFDPVKK